MRRTHLTLVSVTALALVWACGGDDDRPSASLEGTSGSLSSSGKGSRAGSGSQSEGGSEPTSQGGAGTAPGGAGGEGIEFETAGAPTVIPGQCDPAMAPGDDNPQELDPSLSGATLLGMTPDERSVAFVTGVAPDWVLHVGDRATRDEPFEAREVALPPGYEAASGVTLSSDALTLVVVLEDHSGFGALSRAERGAPFSSEAEVTAFSRINAQKAMSGRQLGWPVLSSDGGTLYFLSYLKQALVVQSTRGADGRFDLGKEIDEFTLGGDEGAYRRINAVSADQRAIFFFDEATERAMALFRSAPNAPFYEPIDLGPRRGVVPNADCTRLYSSVDGQLVSQELE